MVGNTDELLWQPEEREAPLERAPKLKTLLDLIFDEYAPATLEQIGPKRLAWLRRLPSQQRSDGLVVLHASPHDLWHAPMAGAGEEELVRTYASCDAAVVVYGHIHRPFVRRLEPITVANSGSVGAPYDSDPRASYLLADEGEIKIVRVEYDIEREIELLLRSHYPGRVQIAEMRRRGCYVAPAT